MTQGAQSAQNPKYKITRNTTMAGKKFKIKTSENGTGAVEAAKNKVPTIDSKTSENICKEVG